MQGAALCAGLGGDDSGGRAGAVFLHEDGADVMVPNLPDQVDQLLGDPTKARTVLGWEPKVKFRELVKMMMDADLELARKEAAFANA